MTYGNSQYAGDSIYGGGAPSSANNPVIALIHPQSGQTGVSPDSSIIFSVNAPNGLDESLFKVQVDGDDGDGFQDVFVYDDEEQFKGGWDGPLSMAIKAGNLYTVVLDPWTRFQENRTIEVSITATDILGNPATIQ